MRNQCRTTSKIEIARGETWGIFNKDPNNNLHLASICLIFHIYDTAHLEPNTGEQKDTASLQMKHRSNKQRHSSKITERILFHSYSDRDHWVACPQRYWGHQF
jgi:hypothetical protein